MGCQTDTSDKSSSSARKFARLTELAGGGQKFRVCWTQTRLPRGSFASRLGNARSLFPLFPGNSKLQVVSLLIAERRRPLAGFGYKSEGRVGPRCCTFICSLFYHIWYLRRLNAGVPKYRDRKWIGRGSASRSVKAYAWKKVGVCSFVIGDGTKSFLCWSLGGVPTF